MCAPAMRASSGLQTPQAITTVSASIVPREVCTRLIRPCSTSMPLTSVQGTRPGPGLDRALAHDRAGAQRVDDGDGGAVEASEEDRLVDVRHELLDLGRGDQARAVDAPCLRRSHTAPELLQALFGPRHLDAAALGVHVHRAVLALRLEGELCHLLRVVDGEDEVRGVARGAARIGQRALVDEHDVRPALLREVVGEAVADDAAADHDGSRGAREAAHDVDLLIGAWYLSSVAVRARRESLARSLRYGGA